MCVSIYPRLDAIRLHFGIAIRTFQIVMFVRTNMLLLPDRTDKSIAVLSDFRWTRSCDCMCAWLYACVCVCVTCFSSILLKRGREVVESKGGKWDSCCTWNNLAIILEICYLNGKRNICLKLPSTNVLLKSLICREKETNVKCDWVLVLNSLSYVVRQLESVAGEHIALTSACHTL